MVPVHRPRRPRRMPRLRAPRRVLAFAALLGTLLLLGGAGSVSAHSALRATDPGEGSVLKTAPEQVTLTFTESVGLADDSLRVLDPENRRVNTGNAAHADGRSDTARVRLRDGLPDGTFTVAWRVVSADSHPISGAFTFSIGKPSATTASVTALPAVNPASGALYDLTRYAAYAAGALLIGAATFVLVCRPAAAQPLRGLLRAGWWTLLGSTLALLILRGPYARSTGPSSVLDPELLQDTLTTRPGWALLARLALLAVAALFLVRVGAALRRSPEPGPAVLAGGTVLAVALAVTWAAAEHASAGIQVPVAMTSSVLHLLAMAVWLGGLAALLTTLHRADQEIPAASVARFSRLAFTSVTVLVLTGVYQSWRGLGSWDAVLGTSYGRLLVVKVCAVAVLLAAAGFSRRWTGRLPAEQERTPVPVLETAGAPAAAADGPGADLPGREAASGPASGTDDGGGAGEGNEGPRGSGESGPGAAGEAGESGENAHRRSLRRSVLAEVVVGVVVLVVTTMLTGTQPGRAETGTTAAGEAGAGDRPTASTTLIPFDVGTPGGHGKVQIVLEPGRVGENTVQAVVIGPDGGIATVPEIRLTFTLPSQKVGPLDAELTNLGGYWGTQSLNLPLAGTWTMKVTVRTSDIDQVTESRRVRIAR
ncbi:copper resistance protein CopC [Streptomyces fructofermentans]